jgi:PAS domain S-box-containing protein
MPEPRENGVSVVGSNNFIVELRQRAINKKAEAIFDAHPGGDPEWLEELRIHQIELEIQNEELRLARTDLERSRARYFDLYDQAPVGYVTIDDDGAVLEMNVRANALLAVTREAPPDCKFLHYIAAEDRDAYYLCRKRLLRTGAPQFCELRMIPLNGSPFWARLEMSLGADPGSAVCRIVIVDITERKTAELQVQESERQLRQQANAMPQIVWTSSPTGEVDYYNERWYEYTGYSLDKSPEQTALKGWQSVAHPADLPACLHTSTRGFANGTAFAFLCRLKRAFDDAYRWHLARAVPDRDEQGNVLRWFGTFTDIHEQEMAKVLLETEVRSRTQALEKLQAKEEELRRSLSEKETLLMEVHHRVKNNLQVISSLLRMQGDLLKDSQAAAALRDSERRIASMAHIHELLYSSQSMDEIDFADYIHALVDGLLRSHHGLSQALDARLNTAPVLLRVDQAIPCGLILNELVTNALKYAYPTGSSGEIAVDLTETPAGLVSLSVADRGVGLPAGFDWRNSKSMGLPIVDLLANQLGGTFAIRTNPGTAFTIEFPKESKIAKAQRA